PSQYRVLSSVILSPSTIAEPPLGTQVKSCHAAEAFEKCPGPEGRKRVAQGARTCKEKIRSFSQRRKMARRGCRETPILRGILHVFARKRRNLARFCTKKSPSKQARFQMSPSGSTQTQLASPFD